MSVKRYMVLGIVCDWEVFDTADNSSVTICNSKANAELICEILNCDNNVNKYGITAPIIWQDQKIKELKEELQATVGISNQFALERNKFEEKNEVLEKALERACLVIAKAMCPNENWDELKKDFAEAYKTEAEKELKAVHNVKD